MYWGLFAGSGPLSRMLHEKTRQLVQVACYMNSLGFRAQGIQIQDSSSSVEYVSATKGRVSGTWCFAGGFAI